MSWQKLTQNITKGRKALFGFKFQVTSSTEEKSMQQLKASYAHSRSHKNKCMDSCLVGSVQLVFSTLMQCWLKLGNGGSHNGQRLFNAINNQDSPPLTCSQANQM